MKLSIESTPEFMQLPLEYQGFCPWTMVNRHGLLLPGKPAIGVVRYQNMFFVFAHATALNAFMRAPEEYKQGVLVLAQRAPELIHLLRCDNNRITCMPLPLRLPCHTTQAAKRPPSPATHMPHT